MEYLVLSLGSNVGNRLSFLKKAVKKICFLPGFDFLALSGICETEPWGYQKQKCFLNCILVCLCRKTPLEVISQLKSIEKTLGRKHRPKWHKREIDIDVLFYGDRIINNSKLNIPHPEMAKRNFVLKPLAKLLPGFNHPVLKKNIKVLLKSSPDKNKVFIYSHSK